MRRLTVLPLCAAFALAACGSEEDSADTGVDSPLSQQDVLAEATGMVAPEPGLYRNTVEILEFTMPGMPEGMMEQVQNTMSGQMSTTYCQTEEDVEQGVRDMADSMGKGNCTYQTFEVSGGKVKVDMNCTGEEGVSGHYVMDGTVSSTGADMVMEMTQQAPGMPGEMNLKARVHSERIGECES